MELLWDCYESGHRIRAFQRDRDYIITAQTDKNTALLIQKRRGKNHLAIVLVTFALKTYNNFEALTNILKHV